MASSSSSYSRPPFNPHIIELEENIFGTDFSVGDIHGCATYLEWVLQTGNNGKPLGPYDRLFIVGDLIDRGPESQRVIDIVRYYQSLTLKPYRTTPLIYVTRGNHEDFLIEYKLFDDKQKTALEEKKKRLETARCLDLKRKI